MMVVILTPVDGIIRWLPRGFSCSPYVQVAERKICAFRKFRWLRLGTPFIVTGGLGLSATGQDGRDTGNLNPVN